MVADDAALFRAGVSRLLADAGFDVTAAVGDAEALLDAVDRDPPDAVVIDIRMPPTHTTEGLAATRRTASASSPGSATRSLSRYPVPEAPDSTSRMA